MNDRIYELLRDINAELIEAKREYPDFHSLHEGYAVLLEELDELWDIVRQKNSHHERVVAKRECIQIAAMAVRLVIDRDLQ